MLVELFDDTCPLTVANFLEYVKAGFYDGTIFHRVIPGFVAQGGGMGAGLTEKPTRAPIPNEAAKAPPNLRGTLAMARTQDPNSATSQFYINLADNRSLDYGGPGKPGYCAFGRIAEGMEVVDQIAGSKTGRKGRYDDVPLENVVLNAATVQA